MGCANSTPMTEVQPGAAGKQPEAEPAQPAAEPNGGAAAPTAAEEDEPEKTYELDVPEGTKPGAKLKLTIPGRTDKVIITVPEGAVPGSTISFSIPPPQTKTSARASEQERAAVIIQARMRGKTVRKMAPTKLAATGVEVAKPEDVNPEVEPTKPPMPAGRSLKKQKTVAEVEAAKAEGVIDLAPALDPTADDEDAVESAPPIEKKPIVAAAEAVVNPLEKKPSGWGFLKGVKTLMGAFGGAEPLPPTPAEAAAAYEVFSVAAAAMTAWESADFDSFAALALPTIAVSIPGMHTEENSMQAVWEVRSEDSVEGVLSVDTIMAHIDEHEGTSATVTGIEHCYDVETHGMATRHAWLKLELVKGDNGSWLISELLRDPIWPLPTEPEAAPEEFRLGMGRTLRGCADVSSLSSAFVTSWLAGDQNRFELLLAPDAKVRIKDFGIDASTATDAFACRDKLLELGSLMTFNSPMIDSDSEEGSICVLAHAHLYDVAEAASNGTQPQAHLALRLVFSTDHVLKECVGDVLWVQDGRALENEGLSFEQPPLNSIYTRALMFVKAWETNNADAMRSMTTSNVHLDLAGRVHRDDVGIKALLAYRETLGELGMLTVDSINVAKEARFEANLHEYGIDPTEHGLPRTHAALKLDFDQPSRDGVMLIKRVFFDMEFIKPSGARRRSTFSVPVANPEDAPMLEATL